MRDVVAGVAKLHCEGVYGGLAMKKLALVLAGLTLIVSAGAGIVVGSGGLTGEDPPTGLADPTSTPDLSSVVSAEAAAKELAAVNAGFESVLKAIEDGDVDALLKQLDWTTAVCGNKGASYCPGVRDGETQPVFDVGPVTFFVTAEGLRPSLELLLKSRSLSLTYAAQGRHETSVYVVGFESPQPLGRGILPVTDSDLDLTGILLTLTASGEHPIVAMDLGLNPQSGALDRAAQMDFGEQRIITAAPTGAAPAEE